MVSNDEAVKKTLDGEVDDFSQIIHQYEKALFVFLYKKVRDRDLALDLLQETFVDALVALPQLRDPDYLSGWLFTIARRKAWLAKKYTEYWDEISDSIPVTCSPADEVIRKELSDIVQKAVKNLPEKLSAVVQMHYLDEIPYPEICEKLGIPLTTLKGRLHLARKQLHDELTPFVGDMYYNNPALKRRTKMELKKPEIKINEVKDVKMDVELIEPPNRFIKLEESAKGECVWFRNEADGANQPVYLIAKLQVVGKAIVEGEECWEIKEEMTDSDGKLCATDFHYYDKRKDGIYLFASISRRSGEMTELYFRSEVELCIFPVHLSVGMESPAYRRGMKVDRVVDIHINGKTIRALETVYPATQLDDKTLRLNRTYFDENGRNVLFERYHSFEEKPSSLLANAPEIEYEGKKWLLYHYVVPKYSITT